MSVQKATNQLQILPAGDNVKHVGIAIFIKKKEVRVHLSESQDFYFATDVFNNAKNVIDNHFLHGLPSPAVKSFSEYVDEFQGESLSYKDQTLIINSLPNDSTPMKRDGVTVEQYMSTGTRVFPDEYPTKSKYIPTSTRNKVVYMFRLQSYDDVLNILNVHIDSNTNAAPSKRVVTQGSSRTKKVRSSNSDDLTDACIPTTSDDPGSYTPMESNSNEDISVDTAGSNVSSGQDESTPFIRFVQSLISEIGCFQWRVHSLDLDVVAMNDVDLEKGTFHKNKFVHVWRWKCAQGGLLYLCNCYMHSVLGAMDNDNDNSCCHIRFMKEFVDPLYTMLFNDSNNAPQTPIWRKLLESKHGLNTPVIRMDRDDIYHRYSVLSDDHRSCAIVTLQGQMFSCLNGKCGATHGHTRKVRDISNSSNCEHLQSINNHREQWQPFVEGRILGDGDDTDDDDDHDDHGQSNAENGATRTANTIDPFDTNSGLYKFHGNSVSQHKPREQGDSVLFRSKSERQQLSHTETSYEFYPNLDSDQLCQCGQKYFDDTHPSGMLKKRYSVQTNLYTEVGIVQVWICDRQCLNDRPECLLVYSGEQDALHILSTHTAAGDEIGWDYINHATRSTTSLGAYCDIMSERYPSGVSFMSRQTFTEFIFSWMSSFRIDFRQTCSVCGDNPQIIACDGTNIGIFGQNSSVPPVESPTCTNKVQQQHSRTDRQFFAHSRDSATHIKQAHILAQKDLQFVIAGNSCNTGTEERGLDARKQHILSCTPEKCVPMMTSFINKEYHPHVSACLHPIMKVLATSYPLSSLINYRFLPQLSAILQNLNTLTTSSLNSQLPEIFSLLHSAITESQAEHIVSFFEFLIEAIQSTHQADQHPSDSSVVIEPYHPTEQGRAYYFTHHGGRVREMPVYSCNDKATKDKQDTTCRKKYLNSASGGPKTTFLFLWFCPQHGHCYGCHIVPGSEGRKDPFSSAFLYMETPPSEVFYDFSCQLEEYCLNREPHFWRECRFYHDIFHGFSHKCPFVYSAKRVPALMNSGINSEICEQFNAYLQKIKFSARSMSQTHFMFYLQFFMHLWNENKRLKVRGMQKAAQAFLL